MIDSPDADPVPLSVTLHVRDHCLCLHLQRAARATARIFDDALRPVGITNGQFSLLMSLNRPEPPTIGDVSAVLAMDRTTLTANLKPLERRGLVSVAVDAKDRRSRRLVLTPEGGALLAEALPIWKAAHASIERDLGEAGAERLRSDLRTLAGIRQEPSGVISAPATAAPR